MPKYFRIKQAVIERIASGAWTPGAMIPSEVELCREFGVSRTTARKAVSDLAHEGRLVVVQGKGTFVAAPKVEEQFVQRAFGIHEDMQRRGITLTTQVLRQEVTEPSPEVARRLQLRRGEAVHCIVRLRFVEEEPILVSTTYVPLRPLSRPRDGESHGVLVVRAPARPLRAGDHARRAPTRSGGGGRATRRGCWTSRSAAHCSCSTASPTSRTGGRSSTRSPCNGETAQPSRSSSSKRRTTRRSDRGARDRASGPLQS